LAASALAFRPVVKAAGPAWSDGTFLLLDVLAQDGDGRATDRSGAGS